MFDPLGPDLVGQVHMENLWQYHFDDIHDCGVVYAYIVTVYLRMLSGHASPSVLEHSVTLLGPA